MTTLEIILPSYEGGFGASAQEGNPTERIRVIKHPKHRAADGDGVRANRPTMMSELCRLTRQPVEAALLVATSLNASRVGFHPMATGSPLLYVSQDCLSSQYRAHVAFPKAVD
jgi:hypothetical protein